MTAYAYLLSLVVGAVWLGVSLLLGRPVPRAPIARFGSLFLPCLGMAGLALEAFGVVDPEVLRLGVVVAIGLFIGGLGAWFARDA